MEVTGPLLSISQAKRAKRYFTQSDILTCSCVLAFVFVWFLFPTKPVEVTASFPNAERVPVTIKSVRLGTKTPTDDTIFTVKALDGYFIQEAQPHNGEKILLLAPGKYLVTATGASQVFPLLVAPPSTELTIQIDTGPEPEPV